MLGNTNREENEKNVSKLKMKQKIAIKYIRITKIAENIGKTHLVLWNKITVARVEKKTTETRDEYPCEDVGKIAQCIVGRWKPYKRHGSYSNEKRNNFNALFPTSNILCK